MEVAKLKDLDRDEYKMYMKMALEDPRHVKAYMIKLIIDADACLGRRNHQKQILW